MASTDVPSASAADALLPPLRYRWILGMRVDATSYDDAVERVIRWAKYGESRTVFVATVNNVMHSYDDPTYRHVMNDGDLVTPDGMPLVWGLRWLGVRSATRVCGPELMPRLLARAATEGVPVGLYGGTPEVLADLRAFAARAFPALRIVYAEAPPFRELAAEEERRSAAEIARSGARIVFVGLGCPKQERWMARNRGRVPAVTVGVGAAFDFLSGRKRQAPRLLQRAGLEWAFRLATEPRRLWRRYLKQNPRFVALFAAQLLGWRRGGSWANGGSR
ncbi:MAG: UDP-N-acetyl-D-mannosaminuronic acid transferase [Actinomycetota bacterium]|nr:MAG: UDP-N-acetyl-D-mannosaminuronic acid transferase [Actinomycetota bacterium]